MGTTLRVIEIFESLQGEGHWTGTPMTFVRLAGCNAPALGLECVSWCDTRESWDAESGVEMGVAAIINQVYLPRLCLTGGEPLLQIEGVRDLMAAAHGRGLRVHLETNGTVDPQVVTGSPAASPCAGSPLFSESDWVVVSPKPPSYFIASGWMGEVSELKLIADERLDTATAERLAAEHPAALVCIQPEYKMGRRSVDKTVEMVMSHPDWRLSLQMHKFLGMR